MNPNMPYEYIQNLLAKAKGKGSSKRPNFLPADAMKVAMQGTFGWFVSQESCERYLEGMQAAAMLQGPKIRFFVVAKFCKFLAGSFSAVLKRNFARKYAFDSIFQALQDLHPFAPLQSQNFRKKSV